MGLQDIQIKIILGVQNMGSLGTVNRALGGTYQAANAVTSQTRALQRVNLTGVKTWGDVIQKIGAAQRDYDSLYRAAYRFTQVGQQLQDLGKAGIGILAQSASAWGDYEFALNRAAGAMLENRNLYPQLSRAILDVAKQVRLYSPKEVAMATYYWASTTGQQVKTLGDLKIAMQGVLPIMKAAALTETDFQVAIKGVYGILTQFHMPLTKTADVTEKLMLITQRTALEFPDLIQSFKYIGPVAHDMHIKFDDMAKMFGILGDAAQKGSMSGRGFGMMLQRLLSPTAQGKAALDKLVKTQLGLNKTWLQTIFPNGKFVGARKLIDLLAQSTAKLSDKQRAHVLDLITTQNGMRVLIPLLAKTNELRKSGVSLLDQEKYSLDGAHEAFEKSFSYLADSWKGLIGLLQNSFMPIILQVGKSVTDMAKPVVKGLSDVLSALSDWLDQNPRLVDFIVKIVAVGSAVLAVIGSILVFAGSALALKVVFAEIAEALGFALGPLIAVGAAIAGLGMIISKNVGGIRDALSHLVSVLGTIFGQATNEGNGFKADWSGILSFLKGAAVDAIKTLAGAIDTVASALQKINADPVGHQVLMAIAKALLLYAGAASIAKTASVGLGILSVTAKGFDLLIGPVKGLVLAFSGIPALLRIVGGAFGSFTGVVTGALGLLMAHPVIALVVGLVALIAAAWVTDFGGIREIVGGFVDWFTKNLLPGIGAVIGQIVGIVQGLVADFQAGWDAVVSVVGPAVDKIVTFVMRLAQPFIDLVTQHWPAVVGAVTDLVNTIVGVFTYLAGVVGDVFNNSIVPTVANVVSTFVASFNDIAARVGPTITSIITFIATLAGKVAELIGAIVAFIQQNFLPVWDLIVTVVGTALGAVGGALKAAFDFFMKNLFQPFAEFAIKTFGNLFEVLGSIVSGALQIITGVIDAALAVIKGIFDFFTAILKGDWGAAWDAVKGIVTGVFDGIVKIISGALQIIGGIVKGGLKLVLDLFVAIGQAIIGTLRSIIGTVVDVGGKIVSGLWNGVKSLVGWFIDNVAGFIHNVLGFFTSLPGKVLTAGHDVVVGFWNGIKSFATNLMENVLGVLNNVLNFFRNLPGKVFDAGVSVIRGLWDGIRSMAGWIADRVHDLIINIIPGPIRDALGIHSPSRVTAALGVQIMQGLAQGIASNDEALTAMRQQSAALVRAAQAGANQSASVLGMAVNDAAIQQQTSLTFESSNRRDLYLHVDVTSADGSVDRVTVEQLSALIKGPDLVSSLEHMASVD